MRELRRTAVVAGVLGQVAAAVAGVLPWPLLVVAAGLYAGAATLSGRVDDRRARALRAVATGLALLMALVALPGIAADRDSLRSGLGLLLVGVQAVHALTWRARRDLDTALAIAAALLVLGASFAPDILVGLPLLGGWAAVVAGAVLSAGERAVAGTARLADGGRRPAVLPATALAVVLGLAAFLLVPVPETPAQRNPFTAIATAAGIPGQGRTGGTYSSGRLDLRVRGTLSDRPVLEVPADSPTLWRSTVFPFYDGTTWSASFARRTVPGPPWVVGDAAPAARTDDARLRAPSDGTVWAPGEVVRVAADDGPSLLSDGFGGVRARGAIGSYEVTSNPPPSDPAVLRAAGGTTQDDPRWLQLPPRLPGRVRALSAELTASAASRYDAVRAVEQWLRTNATYRLDSPVPARGEDAVDRFLFVDRTGFCEQFAAAETVLLRAAGIPARLVTGLSTGIDAGDGRRLMREKDLHAWVEVSYPGVGWASSDPTAGVPLADGGTGIAIRQRLSIAVDRVLRRAESLPGGRPTLALLLAVTALAIAVLARLHRPRRRAPEVAAAVTQRGPVGPALAAFLRYDARLGDRRRRPAESLAELAARLGPEEAAALAVVEAECYAATPPPEAESAAAVLERFPV
jgi:transglutaminase-like putative cysteine protease